MSTVSDRLRKSATKSKAPNVDKPVVSDAQELVDKVVTMKKQLEDLEAAYGNYEAALKDKTYAAYSAARSAGRFSTSVFCEGKTTNGCMQVFSDKFSNLPVEMEEELRKSDPNYDKHFVEVRKLTVKRDAGKTISDQLIEKLMNSLGSDFDKVFDVKIEIGTVKGMAEIFDELPSDLQDTLAPLQAKPSTRNVTSDGKVI